LDKLGIKPFIYIAEILYVLDGKDLYTGEALEVSK